MEGGGLKMEWIVLMSLMAGIFINVCLVAYILGVLYVFPMAFGTDYDPVSLWVSLLGIILTTGLAIYWYQHRHFVRAFCVLYGWWICVVWMLHRLFLHG